MRESFIALLVLTVACTREQARSQDGEAFDGAPPVEAAVVAESKSSAPELKPRDPPMGFVVLSEAVPGVVLDVRYATTDNFTGAPLPGYVPGVLWVHRSTAAALVNVQTSLAETGHRLRIYDAYRPDRASEAMVAWAEVSGQASLLRDGYLARHSNHARGNTVDVTLESAEGELLDMGTKWDSFSPMSHYAAVRGEARTHRRMLRHAMMRAGFKPYAREWWHFSLPEPAGLRRLDVPYGSR